MSIRFQGVLELCDLIQYDSQLPVHFLYRKYRGTGDMSESWGEGMLFYMLDYHPSKWSHGCSWTRCLGDHVPVSVSSRSNIATEVCHSMFDWVFGVVQHQFQKRPRSLAGEIDCTMYLCQVYQQHEEQAVFLYLICSHLFHRQTGNHVAWHRCHGLRWPRLHEYDGTLCSNHWHDSRVHIYMYAGWASSGISQALRCRNNLSIGQNAEKQPAGHLSVTWCIA